MLRLVLAVDWRVVAEQVPRHVCPSCGVEYGRRAARNPKGDRDRATWVVRLVSRLNAEATNPTTKSSDRIRANQLLGEHLGMFGGKIDATAWIREQAIKEGMDPDEAVREAQAILDSQK